MKNKKKKELSEVESKSIGESLLDGKMLAKMAQGGAAQLRSNADEVNKLNVFPVPDGDTGDNMRMTIESGIAAIENTNTSNLADVMKLLSKGMLLGARGNSGVILSQFFAGMAKGFGTSPVADPTTLGAALDFGVKQAYASVITPTEGTILTVARESVEYAVARITPKSTIRSLFGDLVKEMQASLQRTPEILTVLKEAGVVDSGAAGLFHIINGFNRVLNGEVVEDTAPAEIASSSSKLPVFTTFGPDSMMEYGYCTEFLLQLQRGKVDVDAFDVNTMTDFLRTVGDSIVAFKTDSIIKVHVHTMTPEKVLGFARQFGEFLTVKIENMSVQHTESDTGDSVDVDAEKQTAETSKTSEIEQTPDAPKKKYGIVTVCNGAGIEELFLELGADCIVNGGQTQNPSTQDFLDAFKKTPAENIFVFPNNGNILMAAQQAADIYTDATIYVIKSKDLGMGYVALSSMDLSDPEPESVFNAALEAMSNVVTGYVSPSIRNADLNGVHINKGDHIGIVGKEIKVSAPSKSEAVHELVDGMLADDDKGMITLFFGKDATDEDRSEIMEYLDKKYHSVEAYYVDGGQDIYPYIIVTE